MVDAKSTSKNLADMPLAELYERLAEVVRTVGPHSSTARLYRIAISQNEERLKKEEKPTRAAETVKPEDPPKENS